MQSTAHVRAVFGEPLQLEGKVVVPVARIAYGLGGGYGKPGPGGSEAVLPESGGGGIRVAPAGVLEVTQERTRFIPYPESKLQLTGMFFLGMLLGRLLAR